MTDTASAQQEIHLPAEYEAQLKQYWDEIVCLNEQMRLDQESIERHKTETAALRAETRAILASLQTLVPANA